VVDFGDIVEETHQVLRASLPATISIEVRQEADTTAILADRTQMHQVLMNTCTNAAVAMEEDGGIISLTLRNISLPCDHHPSIQHLKPGRYLECEIRDQGKGIPFDIIDRIFDPFFTTKPQGKGTGMGLAVVDSIVKTVNGAVAVASKPLAGSTFRLFLPLAEPPPMESSAAAAAPLEVLHGNGNIMLVDDEEDLIRIGTQMLERLGYRVRAFSDPAKAIDGFSGEPDWCDLAITDGAMPGMKGDRLTRKLKEIRPSLPVILSSGYASPSDLAVGDFRQLGFERFIMKPFSLSILSKTISEVLVDRHPKGRFAARA
jgi:CheY-like chemotaxis protein